jgi:hypothetical protein
MEIRTFPLRKRMASCQEENILPLLFQVTRFCILGFPRLGKHFRDVTYTS